MLVREFVFADDAAIVCDNPSRFQEIMDCLVQSISEWDLTLSIEKTKMLYQPAPGDQSESLNFVVGDNTLENVTKFGSVLSPDNTLDEEIKNRLSRANCSFGRLAKKVWFKRHVSPRTKVKVYEAFVIICHLYGCQSWYNIHVCLLIEANRSR